MGVGTNSPLYWKYWKLYTMHNLSQCDPGLSFGVIHTCYFMTLHFFRKGLVAHGSYYKSMCIYRYTSICRYSIYGGINGYNHSFQQWPPSVDTVRPGPLTSPAEIVRQPKPLKHNSLGNVLPTQNSDNTSIALRDGYQNISKWTCMVCPESWTICAKSIK